LIQRNIRFSNRTQSSNFPTRYSLVKEPPPLTSGEDALCIICFFLSTTFFKVFFRKALRHPVPPCPVGLSQTRCASARSWLCPIRAPLSNTFFKFFEFFRVNTFNYAYLLYLKLLLLFVLSVFSKKYPDVLSLRFPSSHPKNYFAYFCKNE